MTVRYHFRPGLLVVTALAVGFPARVGAIAPVSGAVGTGVSAPMAADGAPESGRDTRPPAGDWPMWGGRPDHNMVSDQKGLPTTWNARDKVNIKWSVNLGSQTYGNPVVAGGKVFIGTNNGVPRDPAVKGDKGVLLCFAEADGRFLWQAVHDKMEPMDVHDWPDIGLSSTPCVVGDRVYYVSNRGELVCADTEGFMDGEDDGPLKDQKAGERPAAQGADLVWVLDMVKELKVWPHWASAAPPTVVGDLLFVVTGNGADTNEDKVPAPTAPSFIAVNRQTGKVVWSDNSPGSKIVDGQWSAATYGVVNGRPQVVFPGGDGWLYAFEPEKGKLLWKFDCNGHLPAEAAADRKTRNYPVATPVFHDGLVYIAASTTPGTSEGPGCLWAIDASKSGDLSQSPAWKYNEDEFANSAATVAIADGLIYAVEMRGYVHCLEAKTGKHLWKYDLSASAWASPMVADGKVYIGTEDGDVHVLAHGRELKPLAKNKVKEQVYATVTPANGVLFVTDRTHLYAIAEGARPAESQPALAPAATQPATRAAQSDISKVGRDPRPTAGEWPMFRGNPQLTGVATAEPPEKPEVRWKYRAEDKIESSAAVVGGAVYVGCDDGQLYCIDLATGELKWKFKAEGAIRSSPLVRGGVVLFGDDGGVFHAVDAKAGTQKWYFKAEAEIVSSANYTDGKILFGAYDNYLYCLNEADGKLVWKFETAGQVHGTPGLAGDKVLVAGCDENFHMVKLADGADAGSVKLGAISGASAAVSGERVYVGTFANQFLSIDWVNKRIAWTYEHDEPKSPFFASAAIGKDVIVAAERENLVHALSIGSGKERWHFDTKGQMDCSPVIAGQRVFMGSSEGVLYALNLADGQPTWQFDAGSAITASPAVGECIVIGVEDGTIYCLGKR